MKTFTVATVVLVVLLLASSVSSEAREWTIDGEKVVADLQSFDGPTVTLKKPRVKKPLIVSIMDLSTDDLQFIKALIDLEAMKLPAMKLPGEAVKADDGSMEMEKIRTENSQRALELQQLSLRLQAMQYWSQWYDLWVVQLSTPAGKPFWLLTPARNSEQATQDAFRQYPNANLLWVVKYQRRY